MLERSKFESTTRNPNSVSGPEILGLPDAYRKFLEERQSAGAFMIHDPALEAEFWRYFKDDSIYSFIEAGSEEEARVFETPPWEQSEQAK